MQENEDNKEKGFEGLLPTIMNSGSNIIPYNPNASTDDWANILNNYTNTKSEEFIYYTTPYINAIFKIHTALWQCNIKRSWMIKYPKAKNTIWITLFNKGNLWKIKMTYFPDSFHVYYGPKKMIYATSLIDCIKYIKSKDIHHQTIIDKMTPYVEQASYSLFKINSLINKKK